MVTPAFLMLHTSLMKMPILQLHLELAYLMLSTLDAPARVWMSARASPCAFKLKLIPATLHLVSHCFETTAENAPDAYS